MLSMRIVLAATYLAVMIGTQSGCVKAEPKTVTWYKDHDAERDAKVKWCNDDMSRGSDADCLNAKQAVSLKASDPIKGPLKW